MSYTLHRAAAGLAGLTVLLLCPEGATATEAQSEAQQSLDPPEPAVSELPWRVVGARGHQKRERPDDRTDPRVYDFSGETDTKKWLELERLARELEAGTPNRYLIAIFPKKTDGSEAVLEEIERRWNFTGRRVVLFASYLDSVMHTRVSPVLRAEVAEEVLYRITPERIRPFYSRGDIIGGLSSGLYAMDTALTGRPHPLLEPRDRADDERPPAAEDPWQREPPALPPKVARPWYLRELFSEDLCVRLLETPAPLRALLVLPLTILVTFWWLPFPLSVILLAGILTAVAALAAQLRQRTEEMSGVFTLEAFVRLLLWWGPFVAAAAWTLEAEWILTACVGTILVSVATFGRPRQHGHLASHEGWKLSRNGLRGHSSRAGRRGSFEGGGVSGSW